MGHNLRRVAVVGAGMAGLACAAALTAAGVQAEVFDKSRRIGGRLAVRRVEKGAYGLDGLSFNHGAAYATARGPAFRALLDSMSSAGDAAPWSAAGAGRWSGTPGMSALARHMERLGAGTIHAQRHIAFLARTPAGWTVRHLDADPSGPFYTVAKPGESIADFLIRGYQEVEAAVPRPGLVTDEGGEVAGPYDAVLLALPAPQAAALLAAVPHRFAGDAARAGMAPCWALMAAFAEPTGAPDLPQPGGALAWIARDSSRPGRAPAPECWVAHATAAWSRTHLEDDPAGIKPLLLHEFARATGIQAAPAYAAVHRWRYALADAPLGVPALWDPDAMLGVCGDWCLGARVEDAFTSGHALAAMATA